MRTGPGLAVSALLLPYVQSDGDEAKCGVRGGMSLIITIVVIVVLDILILQFI
jgi:hypothetical protein